MNLAITECSTGVATGTWSLGAGSGTFRVQSARHEPDVTIEGSTLGEAEAHFLKHALMSMAHADARYRAPPAPAP